MSSSSKVALVTGSSSGIGYETALTLSRNGFLTYATVRNPAKQKALQSVADKEGLNLRFEKLDVTDNSSVQSAVKSIVAQSGRIDVLVNNAGYGLVGPFEQLAIDEIKKLFETNYYGVVRVTQAVLPQMRKQKSGRIINISSGAGRFGYPGGSAYVSSKFALEGLSECLWHEVGQFGINVVLVEPGFIKTNFGDNSAVAQKAQDPNSPYASLMSQMRTTTAELATHAAPASLVGEIVLEAATAASPKMRYLAGKDVEQWVAAKKGMTDEEFHSMLTKM